MNGRGRAEAFSRETENDRRGQERKGTHIKELVRMEKECDKVAGGGERKRIPDEQ
jgi:hypothetical protein